MESLTTRAFRVIQNNPGLWKLWNTARDQRDRDEMLIEAAYQLGWSDCNADRDSEIL